MRSNVSVVVVFAASVLMSEAVADAQPYRVAQVRESAVVDCGATRRAVVRHVRVKDWTIHER